MSTQIIAATEYRNLPLAVLTESKTNPRCIFEDAALKELADSIRSQGVLSPLLVRPLNERSFEIVAGARRYRAAQMAESETIPVRIVNLTDAEALEAQLIENLQRRDVHPLEEAQGFRALLNLDEPKYSIEQIAAKTGKSPAYVAQRIRLTELAPAVVEAFYKDEIGVGHALMLAKLQPAEQEQALAACFREDWGGGSKSKRILLPVRNLQQWIEHNILLILKDAPFSKSDATLNPQAGACLDCPKRTGHNKLLFADVQQDACTDPACYQSKVDAHVAKTIAAKPKLVQISAAYGQPAEGSTAIPRSKYIEIKQEKPTGKHQQDWPEYKTCKSTTEAIITEGTEKGELRKICADSNCPVHHPKRQKPTADANRKAEQEKQRRQEALAQATGLHVLNAIVAAVPVRLMKRDLLFIVERVAPMLDERRLEIVARNRGIRKAKDSDSLPKLLAAFVRKADEGELGRLLMEMVIVHSARTQPDAGNVLKQAAEHYKVDTDAIALKVKQEFTAKQKAQAVKNASAKAQPKPAKKTTAA
ncbi:MAG TPA: ParB/RepB/Spo0J family partition protein [Acidobacteriaceae bacterium]|nr:ParB/RepB/Spo0J family partition protein [Acidobacteriaceae bacterium]